MPALDILDIGGGFSQTSLNPSNNFENVAPLIENMIQEWPGTNNGVKIIGEPGRQIAQGAQSMAV
jgi:diaminopimelate decarboxylase